MLAYIKFGSRYMHIPSEQMEKVVGKSGIVHTIKEGCLNGDFYEMNPWNHLSDSSSIEFRCSFDYMKPKYRNLFKVNDIGLSYINGLMIDVEVNPDACNEGWEVSTSAQLFWKDFQDGKVDAVFVPMLRSTFPSDSKYFDPYMHGVRMVGMYKDALEKQYEERFGKLK